MNGKKKILGGFYGLLWKSFRYPALDITENLKLILDIRTLGYTEF